MPVRKSGKCLKHLCFVKISENFEVLKSDLPLLSYYVINEFCKAIRFDFFRPRGLEIPSRPPSLPPALFINRRTIKLKFWDDFSGKQADLVIQRIIHVCKISNSLRHVNFNFCGLPSVDLVVLIRSIPQVKILKLENTFCDNNVLTEIKNCCWQIQELYVANTSIDDDGITNLCITNSDRNMTLQHLNVALTGVSAQGCFLALNTLPHLTVFEFYEDDQLLQMLVEMKAKNDRVVTFPSIKSLIFTIIDTRMALETLASFFPNMSDFYVSLGIGVETIAEYVGRFRQLNKLNLCSCRLNDGDTAPIWRNCNLMSVSLFQCDIVDIYRIAHHCPNIEELCMSVLTHRGEYVHRHCPHTPFTHLSKLYIAFNNLSVNDEVIGILLANSKCLKKLIIHECPTLRECFINKVVKRNSLSNLQEVILSCCDNFTEKSVKKLLMMYNSLSTFQILNCKNITECEEYNLKNFIKNCNLDVILNEGAMVLPCVFVPPKDLQKF